MQLTIPQRDAGLGTLVIMLMFLSGLTNNVYAQWLPGDVNDSGAVDAVDVQLVINAALGRDIGAFDADINNDNVVDALDVQLVVNAALGISISWDVTVPNVVGIPQSSAETALANVDLLLGTVTGQYSDTVPAEQVISQNPTAGAHVDAGSSVSLVVSRGQAPVSVPNVVGMTQATAETTLAAAGLDLGSVANEYHPATPLGQIIRQNPAAGTYTPAGNSVSIVVSQGPAPVSVPNVVGMLQAAAETAITNATLTVGTVTQQYSDSVPVGRVVSQNPAAGTSQAPASSIDLVISQGVQPGTVPNVVGMTEAAAGTAITAAGFVAGTTTHEYDHTIPAGQVISQNPAGGTTLGLGNPVDLVVSLGVEPGTVPNVVGMTQAAAGTAIVAAGFVVGTTTQQYSPTIPSGQLISQNPIAGATLSPGGSVSIVVSLGPQPVSVPNVVGMTQAAAGTAITTAGFALGTVTEQHSNTVASGNVISQNPAGGSLALPGSSVALVVSLGPEPVSVPNVVGMTQAAAQTAITGAGLSVGAVTEQYSGTVPAGQVISQNPSAGALALPGTSVAFVVSLGPEPIAVPDVVGMAQADAESAIVSAGFDVGNVAEAHSETVPLGGVISQSPEAGSLEVPGTAIDIVVSLGPEDTQIVMLPGDVPMELKLMPADTFWMGRYAGEQDSSATEEPQHQVTFTSSFWMASCEVTKAQWTALMGTTPWSGHSSIITDADSPAVYVSWVDAQAFVTALNSHTGDTYRLPSEAEWEYACRADTATRFYWGADASYASIGNYAWWSGNASGAGQSYAHVVAQKLPNTWGLYDMSGNAMEWCQDWWHDDYTGAPTDGSAWLTPAGTYRVVRGGNWSSIGGSCRSATRVAGNPTDALSRIGFRVCK